MAICSYVGYDSKHQLCELFEPRHKGLFSADHRTGCRPLASLFDLLFSLGILIVFMLYFRVTPTVNLPIALLFIALAFVLASAVGTLFAPLNIRFRDVKFALPFLLQVWMIASPIFYPSSVVPVKWKTLFALNPMTGIIEGFRSSLFGTGFDWQTIGVSIVSLAVISAVSLYVFGLMEDDFADVI